MKSITIFSLYSLDRIGGTERAVVNLANLLCSHYEVHIITCNSPHGESFYPIDDRVSYRSLNLPDIPQSLLGKMAWYIQFVRAARRSITSQHKTCLIGTAHGVNSMLPLIALGYNTITIGCEHFVYEEITGVYAFMRKLMYPFLRAIVVLTEQAATHYTYHQCVRIIPNYIDLDREIAEGNNQTVLAIGRYDSGKDFGELIQIAALLKQRGVVAKFRLVGDGELKEEFAQMIQQLRVEDYVTLIPPTKEVRQEYLNASVYAMTSRAEALPMVLLEAKKYGLPVVSYACPEGPLTLVHSQVDGFLVPNRDRVAFADKLSAILTNNELRKQLSDGSRNSLKPFTKSRVEQQWASLLTTLINR